MTAEHLDLPNIAVIGKAGAGKSSVADILTAFQYQKSSFAAPLREVAVRLWGEDARNDRSKLQGLGGAVRKIEPDTWVDLFIRGIQEAEDDPLERGTHHRWVVDDCRFPNEAWSLAETGFVFIRVEAAYVTRVARLQANGKLTDEAQLQHESETALDSFRTEHTIHNDGTGDDLYTQVVAVLNKVAR